MMLQELDVNFLLRKAATASTPVVEISEEGGVWNIKQSTTLKTIELKFKVFKLYSYTHTHKRTFIYIYIYGMIF